MSGETREVAGAASAASAGDRDRTDLRLRSLAKGVAAVVWSTSPTGAMTSANPGFEAFTGLRRDQYSGWRWLGAIHPEDAQFLFDAVQSDVEARKPAKAFYRMRRRDGEYREMEAWVTPIIEDGVITEWAGLSLDVTERNAA